MYYKQKPTWQDRRAKMLRDGPRSKILRGEIPMPAPLTIDRFPPETAPKGVPLLVAGGIAMKKTGGEWVSGMTDDPFTRPLNWVPKWWAHIPQQNDA